MQAVTQGSAVPTNHAISPSQITYTGNAASGNSRQHNGDIHGNVTNHIYSDSNKDVDSNATIREKEIRLLTAAAEGQTPRVKLFLSQQVNTECCDEDGLTPLHHAVLSGFEDTVVALLEGGADVNATSLNCGTPLHLAALKARSSIISRLLENRADLRRTSRLLGSAMHCACYAGSRYIVFLLKGKGASLETSAAVLPTLARSIHRTGDVRPRIPIDDVQMSPVISPWDCLLECLPCHLAILAGHSELLAPGTLQTPFIDLTCQLWTGKIDISSESLMASPSRESVREMTTVMLAVAADQPVVLGALLKLGVEGDAQDECGVTPLMMSIEYIHPHCLQSLLNHGVDASIMNAQNQDAEIYAANSADEAFKRLVLNSLGHAQRQHRSTKDGHQIVGFASTAEIRSVETPDQRDCNASASDNQIALRAKSRFFSFFQGRSDDNNRAKSTSGKSQSFVTASEGLNARLGTDDTSFKREYTNNQVLELLNWLKSQQVSSRDISSPHSRDGGLFIPKDCIEDHFQASRYGITRVLIELFDIQNPRDLDITPNDITQSHCSRIFCILLTIGRAHLLRHFLDHKSLADAGLPFYKKPDDFPELDTTFFAEFYEAQWRFSALRMENFANLYIEPQVVLPIVSIVRTTISKEQTRWTCRDIQIHTQHDGYTGHSRSTTAERVYRIRTLHRKSGEESMGSSRSRLLKGLSATPRSQTAILQHYGSFTYRNTFNIISEYAEMEDMMTYFASHDPPSSASAIKHFWDASLSIIKGVDHMHQLLRMAERSATECHVDRSHVRLRPTTILISYDSSTFDGYVFKLAETVFDVLNRSEQFSNDTAGQGYGIKFTQFEAIEYPSIANGQTSDLSRSCNKLDVWSLGCFFSTAAVWVACGQAGLLSYIDERSPVKRSSPRIPEMSAVEQKLAEGADVKFHDGIRTLEVVDQWHKDIKRHLPPADFVTPEITKLVMQSMLRVDPNHRQSTTWLANDAYPRILETVERLKRELEQNMVDWIDTVSDASDQALQHNGDIHGNVSYDLNIVQDHARVHYGNTYSTQYDICSDHYDHQRLDRPYHDNEYSTSTFQGFIPHLRNMSLYMAQSMYHEAKQHGRRRREIFPGRDFVEDMSGRNFVLIVDDAGSMRDEWGRVVALVKILAYMLKSSSPSGIELYFISSDAPHILRDASEAEKVLKSWKARGASSLEPMLEKVTNRFQSKAENTKGFKAKNANSKPFSLLCLTDGILEAGHEKQGQHVLQNMADSDWEKDGESPSVIHFIQFGSRTIGESTFEAVRRLRDSSPKFRRFLDVVPGDGNIWDMLLQKKQRVVLGGPEESEMWRID